MTQQDYDRQFDQLAELLVDGVITIEVFKQEIRDLVESCAK